MFGTSLTLPTKKLVNIINGTLSRSQFHTADSVSILLTVFLCVRTGPVAPRPVLQFAPLILLCPAADCGTTGPGVDATSPRCRVRSTDRAYSSPTDVQQPAPLMAVRTCCRRAPGPAALGRAPPTTGVALARTCRFSACPEVQREDASGLASS
jgi:hypothetical protein